MRDSGSGRFQHASGECRMTEREPGALEAPGRTQAKSQHPLNRPLLIRRWANADVVALAGGGRSQQGSSRVTATPVGVFSAWVLPP
jgi:hypothetical protein